MFHSSNNVVLSSGFTSVLSLLLDTHQSEVFGSESGSFTLALNEAINSFDVITNALVLSPGQKTSISIAATLFKTKNEIRNGYSIKERKCMYRDEGRLTLFKQYSKQGCEYECALKAATEEVGCVPWNYLHLKDDMDLCTRGYVKKFEDFLLQSLRSEKCRRYTNIVHNHK